MTTTVTAKGRVTLPKDVRDAVGIKPGDRVDVRATASGAFIIEKAGAMSDYKKRPYELAERRIIRGIATDEIMRLTRGDPDDDYS